MLIARLHKFPGRKRLSGNIELAVDLPKGTLFELVKASEFEYQLMALLPTKKVTAKVREATKALFEDQ